MIKLIDNLEQILLAALFVGIGLSAMIRPYLGIYGDIHAAGVDNYLYASASVASGLWVLYAWYRSKRIPFLAGVPYTIYAGLAIKKIVSVPDIALQALAVYVVLSLYCLLVMIRSGVLKIYD